MALAQMILGQTISISDFKFGAIEGIPALVIVAAVALTAVLLLIVALVNVAKAIKEKKDDKTDAQERAFFAEYGVDPEEVRLNQKLALLKEQVEKGGKKVAVEQTEKEAVNEQPQLEEVVAPVEEPKPVDEVKVEEPKVEEPKLEEPKVEDPKIAPAPVEEPKVVKQAPVDDQPKVVKPAPVEEPKVVKPAPKKEEPKVAEQPKAEPIKEEPKQEPVAKVEEPKVEEPKKQGVDKPATKKIVKKKPENWSKYDGDYEGYYYDPEDGCYYEGQASEELAAKIAVKRAELEAAQAKSGKKVQIKKIAPPFAVLNTPKHNRQAPKAVAGFDDAQIYGKYVIEHVGEEYFYTLYDNANVSIYESGNYSSLEYCQRAIQRFKAHAIIGTYTIEQKDGKFAFVLKRKSYSHRGHDCASLADAENNKKQVKSFAQTDIIREQ